MTEARPSNYWIASNALYITLNANGGPDYLLGNTASGAHILCYMKGIDGLEYDAGHNYRRWPLSLTPTHFETHTEKYVYCAIPRPGNAAEMAVIVFPSEHLDIYGKNETGRQIGSEQYYYIWLQGIISSSGVTGANDRGWTQHVDTGTLASDEAMNAGGDETWWRYSSVDDTVTFLKEIVMDAKSVFHNLKARLLVLAGHELTGVATADTPDEFVDSETLVVTPSYLKKNTEEKFLRKDQDDATPYSLTVGGNLSVGGILRAVTGYFTSLYSNLVQSTNYTGEGIADTGYRLTADDGTGSSALTVDNLHVRKKATFEELEVKKETSVAGNEIRSAAANVINRTDYIDQNGEIIGYSYVKVPWMLRKMPFLLRHKFFGRLRRVRITIDPEHVGDIKKIRCYFLAKDGDRDVKNLWRAHDLVRCQTFNISRSNRFTYIGTASQSKFGNVFWWRKAVLVSTSPVAIDDKEYHYFDVSMDDCAAGSDIPCAGDHAVQFGNDSDEERMNLIIQEVNGTDAPAIKAYTGIYTYDLNKCWWGGKPRKMMLSPKSGYEFYGPSFKFVQEYGQAPASIDRGAWVDIPTERDDYEPHAQVRKCYYYDKLSHNGCYWLCVMSQVGAHWVDASGNYLTQAQYDALPADQKLLCTRRQNYVTSQPGTDDTAWEKLVDKGEKGDSVSYDEEHSSVGYAYSSMGTPEAGRDYPSDITSWSQTPPAVQKGKYLWKKDVTAYDNAGTIVYTTTYGVQYQPNDGESVEIDSNRTFIKYCRQPKSQYTGQHPADSDFSLTYPTNLGQGDYLWILNQVAYVGVANPMKSYSVSMLGTDGTNGDPGADGYTTHFAYATSADGSQGFSTTNFNGATYIGTYRDQKDADSTNYRDYVWTKWKGDPGVNGKDGWMITANPANVIITQSLNNNTSSFSSATVSFSAKKGSASATITSVGTPASSEFNVSKSGNTVVVSSPKKHGNPAEYYSEGSFTVTVNVTDPDTGSTVSFSVTVLCYANLLGTWKESVEAGTKTEVARSLTYGYDPEAGEVISIENFGSFIKSSEENISTISRQINDPTTGLVTQISTIDQKADRISLSVKTGLLSTGIDIENGLITLDAGTVKIKNGDTTAALFTNGKIKADYIDAVNIVSTALNSQTITAKDATIKNITIEGSSVFRGTIYASDGEFTGKIIATSGKITGNLAVTGDGILTIGDTEDKFIQISPSNGSAFTMNQKRNGVINEFLRMDFGYESGFGYFPKIRVSKTPNLWYSELSGQYLQLKNNTAYAKIGALEGFLTQDTKIGRFHVFIDHSYNVVRMGAINNAGQGSIWPGPYNGDSDAANAGVLIGEVYLGYFRGDYALTVRRT